MKALELYPAPLSKAYFDREGSIQMPKVSGCYALCRFDGVIFYIGQAKNIQLRIKQHLNNPQKTAKTEFGTPSVVYFMEYPPEKLDSLENTWIQSYKRKHAGCLPLLNKVEAPTGI